MNSGFTAACPRQCENIGRLRWLLAKNYGTGFVGRGSHLLAVIDHRGGSQAGCGNVLRFSLLKGSLLQVVLVAPAERCFRQVAWLKYLFIRIWHGLFPVGDSFRVVVPGLNGEAALNRYKYWGLYLARSAVHLSLMLVRRRSFTVLS